MLTALTAFPNFPPDARVWLYTATRILTDDEQSRLEAELAAFTRDWTSHNQQLRAEGAVLYGTFVVLAADESRAGVSGCSMDKAMRFILDTENRYGLRLTDRFVFGVRRGDMVQPVRADVLRVEYANGVVTDTTPVFDTMVATVGALRTAFEQPLGTSWQKNLI